MKRTRRKFSVAFNTKVAFEAIKERLTLSELAKRFDLHPNQISQWKQELLSNAEAAFSKKSKEKEEPQVDTDRPVGNGTGLFQKSLDELDRLT